MSERSIRKRGAEILTRRLEHVDRDLEASGQEKAALELAHKALLEEPRTLLPCKFDIEFSRFNTMVQRAHCSECGGAVLGWEEKWKFCALCGASITKAEVEVDPRHRMIKNGVQSAMKDVHVNG